MNKDKIKHLYEKLKTKEIHNLHFDENMYLRNLIDNDKLGLKLNYNDIEENFEGKDIDKLLKENYFFFTENSEKNIINNSDKHNNLLIEGENYFALKALIDAKVKVDVIYIDPPYNTGSNDFIYNDKKSSSEIGWVNQDDPFRHSKWLSFMKRRLILAKELLSDTGVIFVSIDDNEQAYLKVMMDEIFNTENFINNFIWISNKKGRQTNNNIAKTFEYIIAYTKNSGKYNLLKTEVIQQLMPQIYTPTKYPVYTESATHKKYVLKNELKQTNITKFGVHARPNLRFPIYFLKEKNKLTTIKPIKNFIEIWPRPSSAGWRWSKEKVENESNDLYYDATDNKIYTKNYDYENTKLKDIILCSKITTKSGTDELKLLNLTEFEYPKPTNLISFLLNLHANKNAIILDFFAGSGTTGHAVMELNKQDGGNRKFILCTNNEWIDKKRDENKIKQYGNDFYIGDTKKINTRKYKEFGICRKVTYERLYRIIKGKTTTGNKDYKWIQENNPYNENLIYLQIDEPDNMVHKLNGEYEMLEKSTNLYKKEFNLQLNIKTIGMNNK